MRNVDLGESGNWHFCKSDRNVKILGCCWSVSETYQFLVCAFVDQLVLGCPEKFGRDIVFVSTNLSMETSPSDVFLRFRMFIWNANWLRPVDGPVPVLHGTEIHRSRVESQCSLSTCGHLPKQIFVLNLETFVVNEWRHWLRIKFLKSRVGCLRKISKITFSHLKLSVLAYT